MNSTATSGKNLQTPELVEKSKGALEIRLVEPSAPNHEHQALLSSLAKRQRMPVPAAHPQPRPARNYGPRRLRYRWVDGLKPWQVHMLHDADAVAAQLGVPLNVFITVFYGATFPGEAAMASTFQRAMKRMGQWLRDHGVRFAFVYVHENPGGEKPNSHVLVHVPAKLIRAFKAKADDWFDALDGGVRVDPRNDAHRRAKGLGTRLGYMCKGADDFTCRRYGGRRAKGGQGPVDFKRAGVAQCLHSKPALAAHNGTGREFSGTIKRAGPEFAAAPAREDFSTALTREGNRLLPGNNGGAAA